MTDETEIYTARGANLAGKHFFAGLLAFGVGVFSLLVSSNAYFNAVIYNVLTGIFVISAVLFIAMQIRVKIRASEEGRIKAEPLEALLILWSLYAPIILYALLSFILFCTSREQIHMSAHIIASGRGRGCSMYYQFNNAPIGRSVSICRDKLLWAAQSGDNVIVSEEIGPLGARVEAMAHQP